MAMTQDLSMNNSLLRYHVRNQIQEKRRKHIRRESSRGRLKVSLINANDVYLSSPSSVFRPRTYGTQKQLTVIHAGTIGIEASF